MLRLLLFLWIAHTDGLGLDLFEPKSQRLHAILIPKLAMITLRVYYEPSNSNWL